MIRPCDDEGRPLPERKYTSPDAARYGWMGGLLTTANDVSFIAMMTPVPADPYRLNEASTREMLTPHVKVESGLGHSIPGLSDER